jgi:uncharacterized damage-inducible protein DinB
MNTPLAEMLRYNNWASRELLSACRALTEQQLETRGTGCSGSVRELLTHLVGGQQTFALRTAGRQHEGELTRKSEWPGFDALEAFAEQSGNELIAIADSLEAEVEVDLRLGGKTYRFPRSFFLVHAVQHGVEHRTEVKVALDQIGIETPDLDGWLYAAAAGHGQEVR